GRSAWKKFITHRGSRDMPVAPGKPEADGAERVVPLSVLDLSPVSEGSTPAQALRNTLDLAQHCEAAGYRRYRVAERHFADGVASSSPAVLIAAIAAATSVIRVGSGAVQLGHQTATVVAEAFGTLSGLYPGRIDLGLGRSMQKRREVVAAEAADGAGAPGGGDAPGRAGGAGGMAGRVEHASVRDNA